MKLLVAIASTLFVVLVSQQFASALPLDGLSGFTTEKPMAEHDDFEFDTTIVPPTMHIAREVEEPLVDETTMAKVEESVEETEKDKRAKTVKVEKEEPKEIEEPAKGTPKKVKVTVEDEKVKEEEHKEIEEPAKETPKKMKVTVEDEKVKEEEHKELEGSTKETPTKVKVTVDDEKVKEEEHKEVEESTKEIPKKVEDEKPEKVDEEKPEKVDEEKSEKVDEEKSEESKEDNTKESDFCPEGYAKFEDSCLHVGTKPKVSARSGKMSSTTPMNNLVENIPVGDDNSCPPGTEYTERGVCQKILTPEELRLKKVNQGCPENSRLVDGQCIFHSFDLTTSSMKSPLETSERMEVQSEVDREEEYTTAAPENEFIVESGFETTMQTVLKAQMK